MIKLIQVIIFLILLNNTFAFATDNLQAYKTLKNKDYDKALFYLSYEANLGDDKAQYNHGVMYKNGLGVPVDKNEAFGLFFLSAEEGNNLANYALGQAY
jgi:TPR repeat protein